MEQQQTVEQWGIFEWALDGPMEGNPFLDVKLSAVFRKGYREVEVAGFYDGDGVYRIRFMPDEQGEWTFSTRSNVPALDGVKGSFRCTEPSPGNHGPVKVVNGFHFAYADGTRYYPFGTTCYAWAFSGEELERQTLEELARSPFNKVRFQLLIQKEGRGGLMPFVGSFEEGFDFTRFEPAFFRYVEKQVLRLLELGIEADLILFHPYNKQNGLARMLDRKTEELFLRYVLARLGAFRNVWWSVANEFDLVPDRDTHDWDRLIRIISENDPYRHLCSIHNSQRLYDHRNPALTHASIQCQSYDRWNRLTDSIPEWREAYRKPIILDECGYEGNASRFWGNLPPQEMVRRIWHGIVMGGYVGHGEIYSTGHGVWTSSGVKLLGESPARIAFLKRILDEIPAHIRGLEPQRIGRHLDCAGKEGEYYLVYLGINQPKDMPIQLPADGQFKVDVIDTWEMTITPVEGVFSGLCKVPLPAKPYIAFRIYRV